MSERAEVRKPKTLLEVEADLCSLLSGVVDDATLRAKLEAIALDQSADDRAFVWGKCVLRDLLESPEPRNRALALRALGFDDPRAIQAATNVFDLLLPSPWLRMDKPTKILAFRALLNAATTLENARQIVERVRQAFTLPDVDESKEALFDLLARVLHRWPDLASPRERPVVFERRAP